MKPNERIFLHDTNLIKSAFISQTVKVFLLRFLCLAASERKWKQYEPGNLHGQCFALRSFLCFFVWRRQRNIMKSSQLTTMRELKIRFLFGVFSLRIINLILRFSFARLQTSRLVTPLAVKRWPRWRLLCFVTRFLCPIRLGQFMLIWSHWRVMETQFFTRNEAFSNCWLVIKKLSFIRRSQHFFSDEVIFFASRLIKFKLVFTSTPLIWSAA